jgi:FAD dependent oxidoreductase
MIMGQSAGVAAAQAVQQGVAVQDIDIPKLQKRLVELGQYIFLRDK